MHSKYHHIILLPLSKGELIEIKFEDVGRASAIVWPSFKKKSSQPTMLGVACTKGVVLQRRVLALEVFRRRTLRRSILQLIEVVKVLRELESSRVWIVSMSPEPPSVLTNCLIYSLFS